MSPELSTLLEPLLDKINPALVKYKNNFLSETKYFVDIFLLEAYLDMEAFYQGENKINLGQTLEIDTEAVFKFLEEKGNEKINLFTTRIKDIYNRTLETLKIIDDKCEEFKALKKQVYNKDTTDESLKKFVYPLIKTFIAYKKRKQRIEDLKLLTEKIGEEILGIPLDEIKLAFIRLQCPELGNLGKDEFKKIVKSKPQKRIFAKIEGNLIEYPIAVLNKQGKGSFVEGNFVVFKDKEGNVLSKIGTPYGVLTAFDFNIFVGMMSFMTEVNNKYVLAFSNYALLKRLGLSKTGGRLYNLLEESKKKLSSMTISITKFVKGKKENITAIENYPVFSGSYITTGESTKKQASENPLHFNYFLINPLIAESLALKYLAWIDIKIWNRLPTPTAKRLYEYIIKKKGKNNLYYEENIKTLCLSIKSS